MVDSTIVEPYVKWYADAFQLPVSAVAQQFADLGLYQVIDFLVSLGFQDLARKVVEFVMGLASHFVAGRYVAGRGKEDLQLLGSAMMWKLLDPTSQDLVNLANLISSVKGGIQFGNWTPIAGAFGVKSPQEIMAELGNIASAFSRIIPGAPPAYQPPAPPYQPPAPPAYQPPAVSTKIIQFG